MKFKIGDIVTIHAELSAHFALRGTVVEISSNPEDSMPYLVDFGGD